MIKDKFFLKVGVLGLKKMVRCYVIFFNFLNFIIYFVFKFKFIIVYCLNIFNIWYKGFLYFYICFGYVF